MVQKSKASHSFFGVLNERLSALALGRTKLGRSFKALKSCDDET